MTELFSDKEQEVELPTVRVTAGENAIAEGVEEDSIGAKNSVQETLKGRNSVDSMSKITGVRKLKHTDSLPHYSLLSPPTQETLLSPARPCLTLNDPHIHALAI